MSPEEKLNAAEIRYKSLLEDYFIQTWGSTILYSHDIDHHRRVWKFARELFLITGPDDLPAEKLLIASYLHDLGMATEAGEKHGTLGMELCRSFLEKNNMDLTYYSDVANAIENHDDKEYKNPSANNTPLLKILSAADDLDAFGYTGAYRYIEIYLARGIDPRKIGYEIIRNASVRFTNFESGFRMYPALIEKHKSRYHTLHDFMVQYNRETDKTIGEKTGNPRDGIVRLVSDMIRYKVPPWQISTLSSKYPDNRMVKYLIEGLTKELIVT